MSSFLIEGKASEIYIHCLLLSFLLIFFPTMYVLRLSSASYAGLKEWNKAVDDAKECIRLDPKFVKGYYRLATAQLELEEFDLAQATIKQGLAMDANNAQLLKVLGTIKKMRKAVAQRTASSSSSTIGGNGNSKLDQATTRELYDLQLQYGQSAREYKTVQVNLDKTQREQRISGITLSELEANPSVGAYYRSVGKCFMKSSRDKVLDHLKSAQQEYTKKETDLTQKLEYLGRRMKSQQQNMKELVSSST